MTTDLFRMLLRLAYLTAILIGGGWLYVKAYRFEGMLVVAKGRAERTVVAPQASGGLLARFMPGMPPELLDADNPQALERALDPKENYVSSQLPFAVKVDEVEVLERRPPKDVIELRKGRDLSTLDAAPGATLAWDGGDARLRELRPWVGLLRTPNGAPTAALSLRQGDGPWTRGIFLTAGSWQAVAPDTGLLLRWFKTDAEARERFPKELSPFFGARWGAVDGTQINWFASMLPGTGATLSDDTEVTLLSVEANHEGAPAIEVSLKPKAGAEQRNWYRAGTADGPIRLETPAAHAQVVLLNAAGEANVSVRCYKAGVPGDARDLAMGAVLAAAEGPGFDLRLDGLLRTATPSTLAKDQAVTEAVLDTPAGEVALREGTMQGLKDGTQVRYRRQAQPPQVRYALTLSSRDMAPAKVSLALGETIRRGHWTLTYSRETGAPEQVAVFTAMRSAYTPGTALGGLLIFAGCYGFVIARGIMARRRYSSVSDSGFAAAASSNTGEIDKLDS